MVHQLHGDKTVGQISFYLSLKMDVLEKIICILQFIKSKQNIEKLSVSNFLSFAGGGDNLYYKKYSRILMKILKWLLIPCMRKFANILSHMRRPLVIYDFAPKPF
jgi:hypothetical protein